MENKELIALLTKKKERQSVLDSNEKEIDKVDLELSSSTINKYVNIAGNRLKGFTLLIVSISIIFCSLFLLLNPEAFYKPIGIKSPKKLAENNIAEFTKSIALTDNEKTNLLNKITVNIQTRYDRNKWLFTFFLLVLVTFLLFKRRHLKSLRERNRLILEVNQQAQDIIMDYKAFIKEERIEMKELEAIVKKTTVNPLNDLPQ